MTKELEDRIKVLEEKNESLTTKVNELVACLEENEISRKIPVEYISDETEEEEPED